MVLTMLFSPLLAGAYAFWGIRHRQSRPLGPLKKLQDTFLDTTAQFSIPVAVAAVVRLTQDPPFFEVAFLQSLLTMQFLGLLSATIAAVAIRPKPIKWQRYLVILLYVVLEFSIFMGVLGRLTTSKTSWTTIQELTAACRDYGSIRSGFIYLAKNKSPPIHIQLGTMKFWTSAYWKSSKEKAKGQAIITGFVIAGIVGLLILVFILNMIAMIIGFLARHPRALAAVLAAMSLAFGLGSIVCLGQLEQKRNIMKAVTGVEFLDDQWGFGQVMAVFLWAPLLVQAVYYGIETSLLKGARSRDTGDPENRGPPTDSGTPPPDASSSPAAAVVGESRGSADITPGENKEPLATTSGQKEPASAISEHQTE
ncbi:MAG: hypothetical protein M1840_003969 [Geoglossum simile]|nr:MAG: hypothetical protein M1840_003969 [Geoglossum simile]